MGRKELFSEAESYLIREVADMTASAVQCARQHELTQRRLDRQAALHAFDRAISGSVNLNLTLHIILDQVVSQLKVDAADVYLIDSDTLEATYADGCGFWHVHHPAGVAKARGDLIWRVLQKRGLVAIPDLLKASPSLVRGKTFSVEGFQSYYGIPLIAKGNILGVLEVFYRTPLHVNEEWYGFLRNLGTQAAIAMDHASLVVNLRHTNLKLDLVYNSTLEGWVRALDLRDK